MAPQLLLLAEAGGQRMSNEWVGDRCSDEAIPAASRRHSVLSFRLNDRQKSLCYHDFKDIGSKATEICGTDDSCTAQIEAYMQQILKGQHNRDFDRLFEQSKHVGSDDFSRALEQISIEVSECPSASMSRQAVTRRNADIAGWVCLARLLNNEANWHVHFSSRHPYLKS